MRSKLRLKDFARRRLSMERLEPRQLLTVNLAQFQPTVVDSVGSGSLNEATDGIVSNDSRWIFQNNTNPHWVEVRLQAPYPIGSAHVYLGLDDTNKVSSFDLQYHDGSSWQTITSVVGDNSTDHNLIFPATVTATRFRIHTNANQLQVKEFVLLPPNGPAGYPLGTAVNLNLGSMLAPGTTSVAGDHYAIQAVDGYVADDSRWSSDSSSGTHRLAVRIPTSHEVGSVHLYSGEAGPGGTIVNPISDFTIHYSNNFGSSYTPVPGGTVSSGSMSGNSITGNSSGELVINFSTPVLANRIRISFNQANGSVREMVAFPANTSASGSGYPIGTSVKFESPPQTTFDDFGDAWYRIVSRQNNRALVADETGATQTTGATPQVDRQYQVLYSYALDAYRIRSEDTGQALQVADASLEAGAAIIEGNYSAAPHQLWRLEPTDGGYFQFVNVWSGMVLHTGGAYPNTVTQQPFDSAADPANNQEWKLTFIDDYFKKGTASATVGSFGSSWSYDWNRGNFDSLPHDQFYAPMQFREGWPSLTNLHQKYDDWNDELKPSYLLGFNEPDRADQANMTVATAVGLWPQLLAMDVPLVSPANAHGAAGQSWLEDFSDQTDAFGYRTDYAATHWYSSPNVNNVLNWVNSTQAKSNGRDVWLTEFAVVDWSGGSGNWSEETNYNFILEFMYRAESKANLDKYALFLWTGAEPDTPWEKSNPRSNFFISNSNKALTPFGKAYAAWDGETNVENETLYLLHNRAAFHRLQNDGGAAVEKATIRVEDDSVQWIVQDAGNDEVFITSAVDGRRVKLESGNIVMSEPGATGWGVRWKIQQDVYGWQNVVHSGSGNYLRLDRVNDASGAPTSQTLDVVTPATAASMDSTDWWFVKPYEAAIHSDFGDAPDPYPVTLADDGPRHTGGGPTLGSLADAEADGSNSADSLADDLSGSDDEDGVTFATAINATSVAARTAKVDVELMNADPTSNRLDAWVDFNHDGDWLDDGEQIFNSFDLGTANGTQTLSFTVPQHTGTNVKEGETYARFRVSTAGNLSVTGAAYDGEVEDHRVVIVTNDAPELANPIADQDATEGAEFSFQLADDAFQDPDGDALTYTATLADGGALPSWLSFSATTRAFSGVPSRTDVGSVTVRVTASDASDVAASDQFLITIMAAAATLDFGDAPAGYPVTLAQDGARHTVGTLRLGNAIDPEADGVASAAADSDGADDDGVTSLATAIASTTSATRSSFAIVASAAGKLDAWIDFDGSGNWSGSEQIFDSVEVIAGANTLSYLIPAGSFSSDAAARFRLSTAGDLEVTGAAADGEVEDYIVTLQSGGNNDVNVTSITPGTVTIETIGTDVIVRDGSTILFQGPAADLAEFDFTGSSGDDTLEFSTSFTTFSGGVGLNGGAGNDRLVVSGENQHLRPGSTHAFSGLETIDITGTGANVLTMTETQVATLPDGGQTLRVIMDADDALELSADTSVNANNAFRVSEALVDNGQFVIMATSDSATVQLTGLNWTNPLERLDVNASGNIDAVDALVIINRLNDGVLFESGSEALIDPASLGSDFPMSFVDVTGEGILSALDALRIINHMNLRVASNEFGAEQTLFNTDELSSQTKFAPAENDDETFAPVVTLQDFDPEMPRSSVVLGQREQATRIKVDSLVDSEDENEKEERYTTIDHALTQLLYQ
ncbi:glycosyl hydrolase [Aporhodopirellula aestuarii]|nr:glycosyl hydrolase [Aporhodopirellula aestuarii]